MELMICQTFSARGVEFFSFVNEMIDCRNKERVLESIGLPFMEIKTLVPVPEMQELQSEATNRGFPTIIPKKSQYEEGRWVSAPEKGNKNKWLAGLRLALFSEISP